MGTVLPDVRAGWLVSAVNQARLFEVWGGPCRPRLAFTRVPSRPTGSSPDTSWAPIQYGRAHGLINVLTRGQIGRGLEEPPLRFWRAETFQVDDLVDYLDGKSGSTGSTPQCSRQLVPSIS